MLIARDVAGVVRLARLTGDGSLRDMTISTDLCRNFRFPAEVIEHAVWLYHSLGLSPREAGLILPAPSRRACGALWSAARVFASGACALVSCSPAR